MAFGDSDLGVFTDDFGVTVRFNGSTATGIFDKPIKTALADQGFGGFSSNRPTIKLAYNAFDTMPSPGDPITVDDVDYTIADEEADTDGAFVTYPLKATS
jgi:hypothetical protein